MDLPSKTNRTWQDIVTGKKTFQLKFLASKILLGRLTRSASENPSPDNIKACVDQLYAVFEKNAKIPTVQEDITTIFG